MKISHRFRPEKILRTLAISALLSTSSAWAAVVSFDQATESKVVGSDLKTSEWNKIIQALDGISFDDADANDNWGFGTAAVGTHTLATGAGISVGDVLDVTGLATFNGGVTIENGDTLTYAGQALTGLSTGTANNNSLVTQGYVDDNAHWSKASNVLTPSDPLVQTTHIGNSINDRVYFTTKNSNTTGDNAASGFNAYKGTNYWEEALSMSVYGDSFYMTNVRGNAGVLAFEIDLFVGTGIDGYNTYFTSGRFLNGGTGYYEPYVVSSLNKTGFSYAEDYSTANAANDRWLVDKGYVDGAITSSTLTFENGLTETSGTVSLGGTLSNDTTILGTAAGERFTLGNIVSDERIERFTAYTSDQGRLAAGDFLNNDYSEIAASYTFGNPSVSTTVYDSTSGESNYIEITESSMTVHDGISSTGLEYSADYSSANTTNDRWIVDKAYVDNAVGNAIPSEDLGGTGALEPPTADCDEASEAGSVRYVYNAGAPDGDRGQFFGCIQVGASLYDWVVMTVFSF
ncbi:hypothetical protein HC823_00500 [Candidatus Gracilibacteria bacterium]|nr:hypothetical protein [Candidatus Gracilibacteria bacterium]